MFNITESTCRVCLQEQDVLINIYDELEGLNTNLSNLLETCASFQVNENDVFPKYLCEDCTRELLITSTFRDKCNRTQEILQDLLMNTNMENEGLSNSNDLIEYCTEDSYYVEEDAVIIQDTVIDEAKYPEEFIDEIAKLEPTVDLPLLNKSLIEPIKETEEIVEVIPNTELTNPSRHEIVVDDISLSEDTKPNKAKNPSNLEEHIGKELIAPWENTDSMMIAEPITTKPKKSHVYKCDLCGALFKQAINLQKHFQTSHNAIHNYLCNKCEHCFSLETEFRKHVEICFYLKSSGEENAEIKKTKTEKVVGAMLESQCNRNCLYCERDFPTPFALRMHLRTHTGERPFHCKFCSKSFKTRSHLNVHHKRHIGQADFACTICNKTFYELSNLTVHMRSHTGERPHACTICNKTFTRVFLLQFHMRTHTGEKPFKCNYCDKLFRQHTDLRYHMTIHTGQKQHKCIVCGKSYIKRSHLAQHMRKHPLAINSEERGATVEIENDQSSMDLKTESDHLQNYGQNSEILYSFDEVIESEDADNFV